MKSTTIALAAGTAVEGASRGLLAATGRFDVVLPVSGTLAPGYQPPPPTSTTTIRAIHGEDDRTLPATAGAAAFRAFSTAGYKGDFSRVRAGHALVTLGQHIAPLLTATRRRHRPVRPAWPPGHCWVLVSDGDLSQIHGHERTRKLTHFESARITFLHCF